MAATDNNPSGASPIPPIDPKQTRHTFIVEHLDPELEAWQLLEYNTISKECTSPSPAGTPWQQQKSRFLLSGLPNANTNPGLSSVEQTPTSVADLMTSSGIPKGRVCLLDPKGEKDICPEDGDDFDVFVFGGILGDDPPRDRTAELRVLGFAGRRLGKEQLTTDTAARVVRWAVQGKVPLDQVPYIDRPSIEIAKGESIEMPFKYVKGEDGKPVMPEGMLALLADDADKGILDLL